MELVEIKPPEDDSSSQWGVRQSLKETAPPPGSLIILFLIPNLSIYENQTQYSTSLPVTACPESGQMVSSLSLEAMFRMV